MIPLQNRSVKIGDTSPISLPRGSPAALIKPKAPVEVGTQGPLPIVPSRATPGLFHRCSPSCLRQWSGSLTVSSWPIFSETVEEDERKSRGAG